MKQYIHKGLESRLEELIIEDSLGSYKIKNVYDYETIFSAVLGMRQDGYAFLYKSKIGKDGELWIVLDDLHYKLDDEGKLESLQAKNVVPNDIKDLNNVIIVGSLIDTNRYKSVNGVEKRKAIEGYNNSRHSIDDNFGFACTPFVFLDGMRKKEAEKTGFKLFKKPEEIQHNLNDIYQQMRLANGMIALDGGDRVEFGEPDTNAIMSMLDDTKSNICLLWDIPFSILWGTNSSNGRHGLNDSSTMADVIKWAKNVNKFALIHLEPIFKAMGLSYEREIDITSIMNGDNGKNIDKDNVKVNVGGNNRDRSKI